MTPSAGARDSPQELELFGHEDEASQALGQHIGQDVLLGQLLVAPDMRARVCVPPVPRGRCAVEHPLQDPVKGHSRHPAATKLKCLLLGLLLPKLLAEAAGGLGAPAHNMLRK